MAITGDVGAGKSTVSGILQSKGWALIDADRIVAGLWRTSGVIDAAVERWGEGILDNGAVTHSKVGALIFNDMAEYDWAMGLIHPLVKKEMLLRVEELKGEGGPIAAEIPMLFEAGVASWVTLKTFVTASREVRLKRCAARGWDEAEVSRRESFFMPSNERMALSDFVIRNDGTLDELRKNIDEACDALACLQEGL
jgi:dephospho-CoA kinase